MGGSNPHVALVSLLRNDLCSIPCLSCEAKRQPFARVKPGNFARKTTQSKLSISQAKQYVEGPCLSNSLFGGAFPHKNDHFSVVQRMKPVALPTTQSDQSVDTEENQTWLWVKTHEISKSTWTSL